MNPNIALQVRPVEFNDPLQQYGRVTQLKSLLGQQDLQRLQIEEATRERDAQVKLSDVYRNALNPETGAVDRTRLTRGAADAGLGYKVPALLKGLDEAEGARLGVVKTQGEIDERAYNMSRKRAESLAQTFTSLAANPNVTHDDVMGAVANLARQGLIKPEEGATAASALPGSPQALRAWLQQQGAGWLSIKDQLERNTPKFDKVNDGQTTRFVDVNPVTNPGGPAPIQMQLTPGDIRQSQDAAASRAVTIRGQNMTDARARETAGRPEWSEELRSWMFRPSASAPGGAMVTMSGPDGKPLPPKGLAGDETNLRKEFADLPQVKSYTKAAPAYKAIVDAASRNNRQSDINLVYGLAKLYDPDSVVREGEYSTIANSQAIPDWLKGIAQGLRGGSRLSENTKQQILTEAQGRIGSFQQEYDAARGRYVGIAQQRGMNPENIVVPINVPSPNAVAPTPAAGGERKTVGGKSFVKINGQWFEEGAK